jgi:hypothetical protein
MKENRQTVPPTPRDAASSASGRTATWSRRALRLVVVFVALLLLFVLGMTAVFALPRGPIRAHVAQSIPQFELEGVQYRPFLGIPSYQLDNYTDMLMLDGALGKPGDPPYRAAMANVYALPPGLNPSEMATATTTLPLLKAAVADQYGSVFPYARYWHGYLMILRPELTLFSYQAVRFINMFALVGLALGVVILLAKRIGSGVAFAFVAALLWVSGIIIPMSLQFSSVFALALLAALFILALGDRRWFRRADLEVFLAIGMLAAFVDLLTAPLVTLGIPLLVLLLLWQRADATYSWRAGLIDSARLSVTWGVGYALCWSSKWLIGSALLGINVVGQAMHEAAFWMGANGAIVAQSAAGGARAHSLGGIGSNLAMLVPLFGIQNDMSGLQTGVVIAVVGLTAVLFGGVIAVALRYHRPWRRWLDTLPLLLVGAFPYAWYAVLHQHSAQHFWFTYRDQVITLFALSAYVLVNTDAERFSAALRSLGWVRRIFELDAPDS